ncbi:hypothetical protein BDN70DRAFT_885379 [Pholiota conissans]|uniref:INO80 complex subunit B-like conserved region domain-containing protein n=1 Tax=Pholiota conissans TaxID=109636 RepID=A0A9P5YRP5_9AGAR|nr:hypothetical protein BDN70DRAFT_885379 [Pholiota conissans]
MAPRTRRSAAAAAAAAALVADMQIESEEEVEEVEEEEDEEVDVEVEDDDQEVVNAGDDEEGADGGEEDEVESEGESEEEEPPVVTPPTQPRLKITLKLPANAASSNGTDAETDYAAFKRTPKRRAKAKVIEDADLESEDTVSFTDTEDQREMYEEFARVRAAENAVSTKPMTTRQAVLASVVDPTHVSLNEGTRSKKQPLNESELALRREETARKRKNLTEKKLEDEKAETINRLLKKQSRPRNKRTNTTDDRSPMPSAKVKTGDDDEGEDEDEAMDVVEQPEEIKPIMYRWVSSLHEVPGGDGERKMEMGITFSVPENILPRPSNDMDVDSTEDLEKNRPARGPAVCAAEGCHNPRKYRMLQDWNVGACGLAHFRIVEKALAKKLVKGL